MAPCFDLIEGVARPEGDRIANQAVEVMLHNAHLARLLFDFQVLMNDADTTEKSHCNGHPGLGHGIHRRAQERHVDVNAGR